MMNDSLQKPLAGDVDYGVHGQGYARQRRADPRIAEYVHRALGSARTVLNIGAGAGSYEPQDRHVLAIEPSAAMRAQRPPHLAPAIHGVAEELPLDDRSVDASMALITVHQWRNYEKGLNEMRRVTRGPIIVMTFDGDVLNRFWLADYAPQMIAVESRRFPKVERICRILGGKAEVQTIPVPIDCTDGFNEAFYARPEQFLDSAVRRSQSAWSFVDAETQKKFAETLRADLESGAWDRRYGQWRTKPSYDGSLRLVVSHAEGR